MNGPDAVGDLFEPDGVLFERVGDEQQALLKRKVPAFVMRFTRKCPGYSIAGSSPV